MARRARPATRVSTGGGDSGERDRSDGDSGREGDNGGSGDGIGDGDNCGDGDRCSCCDGDAGGALSNSPLLKTVGAGEVVVESEERDDVVEDIYICN